jgi:hypothetical protein
LDNGIGDTLVSVLNVAEPHESLTLTQFASRAKAAIVTTRQSRTSGKERQIADERRRELVSSLNTFMRYALSEQRMESTDAVSEFCHFRRFLDEGQEQSDQYRATSNPIVGGR